MNYSVAVNSHQADIARGWPRLTTSSPFASHAFLSQFMDSLLVKARLLEELGTLNSSEQQALAEVRKEIANFSYGCDGHSPYWKNCAWEEAYRIELLLVLAEPVNHLAAELDYRLSIAQEIGVKNLESLRQASRQLNGLSRSDNKSQTPCQSVEIDTRVLLFETVKAIQWQLTKRYLSRVMVRITTRWIVLAASVSFFVFILPYLFLCLDFYIRGPSTAQDDIQRWVGLPLLTCLSSGMFGSYFSRLLYIQKNSNRLSYDELHTAHDILSIIVRGSVGICGAALLFFFLHSGIIEGPLVPNINDFAVELNERGPHYAPSLIANKDLVLLIIWGFLAGFSERFVPNILATTETSLGAKTGKNKTGE